MVFKFLGKGKKSEYFLEAPATNGAEPAAKIANKIAEVADKVTDKVAEVADKVADKVTDQAKTESASAPAKPEPVANGAVPGTSETAKAKKLKKVKTTETKETTSAAPTPAKPAAKPAPAAAPEPVKNFATDYLMPSNMPRRRPGPSLSKFRDMARDVTPRR